MDKTLESFLHPNRAANVKFRLTGFDAEFEMRALSAKEGMEVADFIEERGLKTAAALPPTVAQAMVTPNLRNVELLGALSEKAGHRILHPYDALLELFNEAEIATLIEVYNKHFQVRATFAEDLKDAKK